MNRLGKEASPYLLQHARNPVDWFPWGSEALEKSRREDKPILLSIGYSACHWCHVMERESFENEATAAKMNELFVNVKVDREERPDLDQIYQLVVQIMGRSGGWPLTVFLTPEQKPFFAGTYFPPEDRYGMAGFPKILDAVAEAYKTRRDELAKHADDIAVAIAEVTSANAKEGAAISKDLVAQAARKLGTRFDDVHGGFGSAPKFPNTMALEILLRAGTRGDEPSMGRVNAALHAMRAGGIYDQLGGGFHRYSTDAQWLVPHFEKMLYDNALLVKLHADAFVATKESAYAETAREIATYVLREMRNPEGGFFATQDADSEGHEGKFFVWSKKEIEEVLGESRDAEIACDSFGVDEHGNFESTDKSVLSIAKTETELAKDYELPVEEIRRALETARNELFHAREKRVKPFRDEKIMTSWNGLMIAAMAHAGAALDSHDLVEAAEKAFAFLEARLMKREGNGVVMQRHVLGDAVKGPAFLDDYAFVADGALELYEATGKPAYAIWARDIADAMLAKFWSDADSKFYFTPEGSEALILRPVDLFDHAIPSATSIACRTLLRLGSLMNAKYAEVARRQLEQIAPSAIENPFGFAQSLCELDRLVNGSTDVVIVTSGGDPSALVKKAHATYLPNRTIAVVDSRNAASLEACVLLAEGKPAKSEPVAYVCRNQTCSAPVANAADLESLLISPAKLV